MDSKDIEKICKRYYEEQRGDILQNLRTFARYDKEINYFVDKIMDVFQEELKKNANENLENCKKRIKDYIDEYCQKQENGIVLLEEYLNNRVQKITKKEPYDIITSHYMKTLEKDLKNQYYTEIEGIKAILIFFFFILSGLIIYIFVK